MLDSASPMPAAAHALPVLLNSQRILSYHARSYTCINILI